MAEEGREEGRPALGPSCLAGPTSCWGIFCGIRARPCGGGASGGRGGVAGGGGGREGVGLGADLRQALHGAAGESLKLLRRPALVQADLLHVGPVLGLEGVAGERKAGRQLLQAHAVRRRPAVPPRLPRVQPRAHPGGGVGRRALPLDAGGALGWKVDLPHEHSSSNIIMASSRAGGRPPGRRRRAPCVPRRGSARSCPRPHS